MNAKTFVPRKRMIVINPNLKILEAISRLKKKLSDSNLEPSWNYAEQTFDQDLANQRVDAENAIKRLDQERDNLLSGEKEFCVQKVSKPKNAFNTRIQIGAESTTIELLKYNGLSLGDQNSQNSESTANAETQETQDQLEQHPNTIRKYVAGMLAFFSKH